ncbi:unnamed protein product [Adineta steineri]|uniref:Uncharacterized protein n=1 Tax=Adineta steineri TaxID=433720 RepID=A0A819KLG1_9BILA|nr:unnamed protein product [Adineta steineri]CAF3951398.1 unnamed protein product [Adineta steineri]
MHRILIVLSYVICISYINGASFQLPTTIDNDATEFADLLEKFWNSKPGEINKVQPFIYCKVLETCCEEKQREEAIPLFFPAFSGDKNRFLEIVGSCINSTEQNGGDKWCRTYSQEIISPWDLQSNLQVEQFEQLLDKFDKKVNIFDVSTTELCDDEEKYAFMCQSNKKLIQRCIHKLLRNTIKRFGYKSYKKLVMENKQAIIDIYQEWSAVSIKNEETN